MLRVAIVGARRRVQGTGEFVARLFAALGCQVEAIVGTSESTLSEALRNLSDAYGLPCRGYLSLHALLAAENIDAVAICSPAESHREHLELALEAGCHVLCEKPLVWPAEGVLPIAEAFAVRGLALEVHLQWPWTLAAFERLHPGVLAQAERFEMGLGPVSRGTRMVVDSGSHFLSLLRAIAGPGRLEEARVRFASEEQLDLSAAYAGSRCRLQTGLRLVRSPEPPRRAYYSVNGHTAERRVDPPYRLSFCTPNPDRCVEFEDPTRRVIDDFVRAALSGRRPDVAGLVEGMAQLEELVAAARWAEQETT